MQQGRTIKLLVVDDSPLSQEMVIRAVAADPAIQVVGTAGDPFEARDMIVAQRPDVITCDVEMPRMNGIEFVRQLLPQYFIPVVMVSSVSSAVFDAMRAGAVDFVVKPDVRLPGGIEAFNRDLISKIKIAGLVQRPSSPKTEQSAVTVGSVPDNDQTVIAIGASTGGTEAIYTLLKDLPSDLPGILIVQHIPPVFSNMFAQRLDSQTGFAVKEAKNGDYLTRGSVLVAPGDQHISLKKFGSRYRVDSFKGEKVNGHCPSVDVLFESVAKAAGKNALGILLTGMGYDGAKGLLAMRRKGAVTIGQDQSSSVVYGMPKVAFDIGAVQVQTELANLGKIIRQVLGRRI